MPVGYRGITWLMALLGAVVMVISIWGCAAGQRPPESENTPVLSQEGKDERLLVVTTIFPYYDFVRQIAGDKVKLKLVVPAGMDSHSFEPTPADMIAMQEADVLICNGGEMEQWVKKVLGSLDTSHMKVLTMMDYVDVVDAIGDPEKIATGAAKPTTDMRKLMMADYCTRFVVNTPYFKDGFSYQTGVGGASIASTISLAKVMKERNIRMRFGVGGLTKPMCDLLINGQADCLLDTQDFDLDAVENLKDLKHFRISAGAYADPFNKGAVVNKLDFVILAALEVDVNFNCNVVVGSDGVITGAQGGHPDTAAGAKCTIVITPLLQGRIPAVCTQVTTVTTPGESIDVVITDYGIAINPLRQDLIECMKDVDLPFKTIGELRDIAYSIVGEPEKVRFTDKVVGIIESRDGTIMDVVRHVKKFEFAEE